MDHLRVFVLLALFRISSVLGITGGYRARSRKFPYQVSLQTDSIEFGNFCSGSILNRNWILTGASCVSRDPSYYYVVVGTLDWTNLGKEGTKHRIGKVFIHPETTYDRSIEIALIKLKSPIQFSGNVRSINLPNSDIEKPGLPVVVSGWGETNNVTAEQNRKLRYFNAKVLDRNSCREKYPWLLDLYMCTISRKGQGLCFRDTGSPIVAGDVQIGMGSNRISCGYGNPDQSIRIWAFVDWIKSVINE